MPVTKIADNRYGGDEQRGQRYACHKITSRPHFAGAYRNDLRCTLRRGEGRHQGCGKRTFVSEELHFFRHDLRRLMASAALKSIDGIRCRPMESLSFLFETANGRGSGIRRRLRRSLDRRMLDRKIGAAFVAAFRRAIVDRVAFVARLEVQRRGTVVAEFGAGRITVAAEDASGIEHGRIEIAMCRRNERSGKWIALPSKLWGAISVRPILANAQAPYRRKNSDLVIFQRFSRTMEPMTPAL